MSDPLATRIKAIRSGEAPSADLFEADFDHERAAVLGSVIDLAFDAAPVIEIDETLSLSPVTDVCEYGETREKLQRANAAKTALKNAWNFKVGDILTAEVADPALLEAADKLSIPASGAIPGILGAYPHLRTRLQQGINTAVEEGVNFAWTVPAVAAGSIGAPFDEAAVTRKSLGVLRDLAAVDRQHLGPILAALKGAAFVPDLHSEDMSTKGRNLGYKQNLLTVDGDDRVVLRQDPLDLEAVSVNGKLMKVCSFGPNRLVPLGCPALKIKAFTAAARCVITTFDEHGLWPEVQTA
ncbi:MAG TPA: hypothetical protein VD706_01055 [Candidatus Saccharimonadales bacterium]|nr:hypothetical protein [Candidatus Saccharimonadales bacterium]